MASLFLTLLPAQATRTWISGVGDDANPCSRTAPCKTFAGAISKTAAGGEISVLDPGGYGAVTITKSITLNGDGNLASILASGTNGIVINAAATDTVILRRLHIKSPGGGITAPSGLHGVKILQAKRVEIQDSYIEGGTDTGVFADTTLPLQVHLTNVRISSMGGSGVSLNGIGQVTGLIENSSIRDAAVGVNVPGTARVIVRHSTIGEIAGPGVLVSGAGNAFIERSTINGATNGVEAGPGSAVVRISDNTITGNTKGLHQTVSGLIVSFNNNRISGNVTEGAASATLPQR